VLAGAEINAETDIRPPATAPATLKRPGYPGAHGRRNWSSENMKIER